MHAQIVADALGVAYEHVDVSEAVRCRESECVQAGDRVVDPGLGAVLDRVGADDQCTDDRLGDHREHLPHHVADDSVGIGQPTLEVAERGEQRQEADPDDDRQLPAVEQHDQGRHDDLPDADDADDVDAGDVDDADVGDADAGDVDDASDADDADSVMPMMLMLVMPVMPWGLPFGFAG